MLQGMMTQIHEIFHVCASGRGGPVGTPWDARALTAAHRRPGVPISGAQCHEVSPHRELIEPEAMLAGLSDAHSRWYSPSESVLV